VGGVFALRQVRELMTSLNANLWDPGATLHHSPLVPWTVAQLWPHLWSLHCFSQGAGLTGTWRRSCQGLLAWAGSILAVGQTLLGV
jgi:hypothetical protein